MPTAPIAAPAAAAPSNAEEATPHELPPRVPHPGTIKINVQGAFIVDDEEPSPILAPVDGANPEESDGIEYQHDTKDIRLPNQTAVVSHVAIDVSCHPIALTSRSY